MADTQDEVATKSVEVEKPTIRRERKHKFVFNKCCVCVPLRTGCLILAYLFLVSAIANEIQHIWGTATMIYFMSLFPESVRDIKLITLLVMNVFNMGLALFAIPFNAILVIGLHKEKRNFVKLFVRFQLAYTMLNTLPFIYLTIMGYANTLDIVLGPVALVLNIFYVLVIRSQYLKMGAKVSSAPDGCYKDGHVVITP